MTTPRLRLDNGLAWIGDRRLPEGTQTTTSDHLSVVGGQRVEFHRRSFELPFESGWTLEVSWGRGPGVPPDQPFEEEVEAATVVVKDRNDRVVVWSDAGEPLGKSLDHPGQQPNVGAERILELIDELATWPTDYLPILDRT